MGTSAKSGTLVEPARPPHAQSSDANDHVLCYTTEMRSGSLTRGDAESVVHAFVYKWRGIMYTDGLAGVYERQQSCIRAMAQPL